MGKGNRTKQDRATGVLADTGNKKSAKQKRNMPTWVGTLIVVSVLVVLVLFSTFAILNSRGVFLRGKIIAATENYEVTVPMMSYMIYSEYENWVSTYQDTGYMQYIKGTGGESLSTSLPLRDQIYSSETDETTGVTTTTTWFDYFAKSASANVKQILILCEQARYYGVSLNDSDYNEIDQAISMLELYAAYYGYTFSGYLNANYGQGVSEGDVRTMMELSQLATKFSNLKQNELESGLTDVRIDLYYEENKEELETMIDYIGYEWKAEFTPVADTEEGAAEKNATLLSEYQAKQKLYAERAQALADCKTKEAFSALLLTYLTEDEIAACDKNHDEDAEGDDKCTTNHQAKALELQSDANQLNYEKKDDSSDLEKWLFAEEGRKINDTTVLKAEESGYEVGTEEEEEQYVEASSTYGAYYVVRDVHADDELLHNVGHILFKDETFKDLTDTSTLTGKTKELAQKLLDNGQALTAENMSRALLEAMLADGKITTQTTETGKVYYSMDKSVFEEYGDIYNEDSNIFYEDVEDGQMVKEFEAWMQSPDRHACEISYPSAVKTEYGYHIMYYVSTGHTKWEHDAREELLTADFEAWYESVSALYTVSVNDSYWTMIN